MKRLLTIIILMVAIVSNAQNTITLTNNDTIKGKITSITNEFVSIISADSIHTYDVPYPQINSYDAGKGIVVINGNRKSKAIPYNTKRASAGDELVKASNTYYTGMVISTLGLVVSSAGSYAYGLKKDADPNTQKTIVYAGIGVAMVGMIVNISAFSHIAKAGRKLNATVNSNGLGISMKF